MLEEEKNVQVPPDLKRAVAPIGFPDDSELVSGSLQNCGLRNLHVFVGASTTIWPNHSVSLRPCQLFRRSYSLMPRIWYLCRTKLRWHKLPAFLR